MSSNILTFSANINTQYPIAGQNNSSQGFRDNFSLIANAFTTASNEITVLQSNVINRGATNDLGSTTSITAGNIGNAATVLSGVISTADQPNITSLGALTSLKGNVQYSAPASGDTVAISTGVTALLVEPDGTIATLTINMPSGNDGQTIFTGFANTVTALTMNPGGGNRMPGALTTAGAGTGATWVFYTDTWYKVS